MTEKTPEDYFPAGSVGLETFRRVHAAVMETRPDATVRVSKSQVAFRRRRGFAYLWTPGQYLRRPAAPVVLSIATDKRLERSEERRVGKEGSGRGGACRAMDGGKWAAGRIVEGDDTRV